MSEPFASGSGALIRLIVNADDFGLSERITEGIVMAHRAGIVTAASLTAVGAAFKQAVRWSRALTELDVGVHLTAVAGKPLLASASSLTGGDGRFPPAAGAFFWRYLRGVIRPADLRTEWAAQIERVLDHGVEATHLDSHQHVHALPGIAGLALDLARRYGIPFVRVPSEALPAGWPLSLRAGKRLLGSAALRACVWSARLRRGVMGAVDPVPAFLGFLDGGRLDKARLRRLLARLRPGRVYELMCHPGFEPQEPEIRDWQYGHEKELHALTRPAIRSELAARGVALLRFKDLAPCRPSRHWAHRAACGRQRDSG
jgi:predicted glycoside hydrolase/deacetylase ChbG (UPF0249 family)